MEAMACDTLKSIWPSVKIGLGFNVMSKHVDWEREDLFHWGFDEVAAFLNDAANGFQTMTLPFKGGLEMSVRRYV